MDNKILNELISFVPKDVCRKVLEEIRKRDEEENKNISEVDIQEFLKYISLSLPYPISEADLDEVLQWADNQRAEEKQIEEVIDEINEISSLLVGRWREILLFMWQAEGKKTLRLNLDLLPSPHERLFKNNNYESWTDELAHILYQYLGIEETKELYEAFAERLREILDKYPEDGYAIRCDSKNNRLIIKKDENGYFLEKI